MFVFIFLAFTLRFICAWIEILILGVLKNYTQISVHICKSSVMLVDHMIDICHPFENKFVLCVWLQDTVGLPTVPGYSAQTQTISRFNSFFFGMMGEQISHSLLLRLKCCDHFTYIFGYYKKLYCYVYFRVLALT